MMLMQSHSNKKILTIVIFVSTLVTISCGFSEVYGGGKPSSYKKGELSGLVDEKTPLIRTAKMTPAQPSSPDQKR